MIAAAIALLMLIFAPGFLLLGIFFYALIYLTLFLITLPFRILGLFFKPKSRRRRK